MSGEPGKVRHRDGHGTRSQGNPVPPPAPLPGDPTAQLAALSGCVLPALDDDITRMVAIARLEHARDLSARTATAFGQILDAIRRPHDGS